MNYIKVVIAAVLGIAAVRIEMVIPLIALVVVAMIFDYVTGFMAGYHTTGLKSRIATKGLFKKTAFLLLLFFGFFLDIAIPYFIHAGLQISLPFSLPFGVIIAAWIVITESISVVENLVKLDVAVPGWLLKLLKSTQEKLDKEGEPDGK